MLDSKLLRSPALVFLTGLVACLLATALVYSGAELVALDLVRPVAVGTFAASGATLMAVVQRLAGRRVSDRLSQEADNAKYDALTGLVNRAELYRSLDESLVQAGRENTVFGVLFLDLNRFKVINDSLGHDAGDELLKIVADRLRAATRSTDVVARLGGDEFVVVCRGLLAKDSVEGVARQITKRLGEPVQLNGRLQEVSASIGIAVASPDEERGPDDLIRDADAAMYKAKRDRCSYSIFDDAQRSQLIDRLDLERDLSRAIEEKQLVVYYQPIITTATGQLYGFEALIRWNHPERGFITPADFLPVAEDARLMGKIGEMVLREACAQAALWNHITERARCIRITVNLAEQQLANPDLPSIVAEVLDWSGLDPEQLVLEITEDVIVEQLNGLTVLYQLRDLGVHLAIDDFGTGQSSLSYIKQFDMVSTLKIDQSFVSDMHAGPASKAIIEAIVAMASALDLSIVAEGVENTAQVEALSALGVDLMQGFLFDRPLSADAVGNLDSWLNPVLVHSAPGLTPETITRTLAEGQLPA